MLLLPITVACNGAIHVPERSGVDPSLVVDHRVCGPSFIGRSGFAHTSQQQQQHACSCSLAELQASAPLHLRGASEVANTRVAFCRSFRITIQIGTCARHAVVCAALDRTAWHMSLAVDNLLSNDDGVEQ